MNNVDKFGGAGIEDINTAKTKPFEGEYRQEAAKMHAKATDKMEDIVLEKEKAELEAAGKEIEASIAELDIAIEAYCKENPDKDCK
jgi:hypothetical protein